MVKMSLNELQFYDIARYDSDVIIRTSGCGINCGYCHDFPAMKDGPVLEEPEVILDDLLSDSEVRTVTFAGGDILYYGEFAVRFIESLHATYPKVWFNIHTSGMYPEALRRLRYSSAADLLDIVIDFKGFYKGQYWMHHTYDANFWESMDILRNWYRGYISRVEVRIARSPDITEADINILRAHSGACEVDYVDLSIINKNTSRSLKVKHHKKTTVHDDSIFKMQKKWDKVKIDVALSDEDIILNEKENEDER